MRFFVLALAAIAALTAATVRLVSERNRAVQLGYELAAGSRVQRALEEELRQLRIDRAALLDPKRLAPLARDQGLRTPSPDEIVVVHLAPRPAAPAAAHAPDAPDAPDEPHAPELPQAREAPAALDAEDMPEGQGSDDAR